MFEARKLPSEGGVWVDGLLSDGERFSITRLAAGGETEVVFPGIDLDYDTSGRLVLAVIRATDFVFANRLLYERSLSTRYWEMMVELARRGVEIAAEVDFDKKVITLVRRESSSRVVLADYDLNYFDGKLIPVQLAGLTGFEGGLIGIQVDLGEARNRVELGVGDQFRVVWVARPLTVKLERLSAEMTADDINAFLKGC